MVNNHLFNSHFVTLHLLSGTLLSSKHLTIVLPPAYLSVVWEEAKPSSSYQQAQCPAGSAHRKLQESRWNWEWKEHGAGLGAHGPVCCRGSLSRWDWERALAPSARPRQEHLGSLPAHLSVTATRSPSCWVTRPLAGFSSKGLCRKDGPSQDRAPRLGVH